MLVLGLPANAAMALMVGAMMIHNIQPGPQVMTSNPALFWGAHLLDVDRVLLRDRRVLAPALFGAPRRGGSAPLPHDRARGAEEAGGGVRGGELMGPRSAAPRRRGTAWVRRSRFVTGRAPGARS